MTCSKLLPQAVAIAALLVLSACASGKQIAGGPVQAPDVMVADGVDAGTEVVPEEAGSPQDGLVDLVVDEDGFAPPADWQGTDAEAALDDSALVDKQRLGTGAVSLRYEDSSALQGSDGAATPGSRKARKRATVAHRPPAKGGASPDPLWDVPWDMQVEVNEAVQVYLEYFQTQLRPTFTRYLIRSGRYVPLMKQIFRQEGLPEDLVYLSMIESGYNPYAFSRARASGPWQFISSTGSRYGLRQDYWIDERRDVVLSTHAAAAYLKDLYARFGDWYLALASYNMGEGGMGRAMQRTGASTFWELREAFAIPQETRDYVPKFLAAAIIAKNPEEYGFFVDLHPPMASDTVTVDEATALEAVARAVAVDEEEIQFLNPQLRHSLTPPGRSNYAVNIPAGTRDRFAANFPDIRRAEGSTWASKARDVGSGDGRQLVRHRVRRGETLSTIANRYRVRVTAIQRANNMGRATSIQEGRLLLIPSGRYSGGGEAATASDSGSTGSDGLRQIHHRVRPGETLWKIATRYNVALKDLLAWNGLSTKSVLMPGQRILVKTRTSG
ncbi:MAG: LysM peptidoglycan-binding domain-containing protein [Nitrospirota bacterium]|nr:LysM peptidoglycan-binding domain-containing protein [Nitrospirota bacterium]